MTTVFTSAFFRAKPQTTRLLYFTVLTRENPKLTGPSCLHRYMLECLDYKSLSTGRRHHKSSLKLISDLGRQETTGKPNRKLC